MFVIVLLSVSDSGGDSSGTAGHVYELAVWALACPPILYLDMESSVTSHSFMYNTAAHATAPAIHACFFSLSYLIHVFWASRLRDLAFCGHWIFSSWFGAPLRIPTQGGLSEIPELPRSPFASFLLGHLAFLFSFSAIP